MTRRRDVGTNSLRVAYARVINKLIFFIVLFRKNYIILLFLNILTSLSV